MAAAPRHLLWWLGALYALHSGTSLAYEVIWMSRLSAHLGRTLAAMSVVMAVFMAGFGLGAILVGRFVQSRRLSGRWLFVGLQAVIGLYGLAFPWLLDWTGQLYTFLAPAAESATHHGVRLLVSMLLLLPQAGLMGAVFPLLGTYAEAARPQGQGVAYLYGHGLLWSGIGALAVPLWLVPTLGYAGTGVFLSCLNGVGALGGLWLLDRHIPIFPIFPKPPGNAKRQSNSKLNRTIEHWHTSLCSVRCAHEQPNRAHSARYELPKPTNIAQRHHYSRPVVACALSGLLGFTLFAVEHIGATYLWLIVDATVYAEGMLLGTVLLGMTAGTCAYLWLRRVGWPNHRLVYAGGLLFLVTLMLWFVLAADIARLAESALRWTVTTFPATFGFFIVHGLLVLAVLGGPAVAVGLTFPALCAIAIVHDGTVTRPLGRITAWHYLGAVLGSLGTAFVLLPGLGMSPSLALLTVAMALMIGAFLVTTTRRHTLLIWSGTAVTAAMCLWFGTTYDVTFQTAAAGPDQRVLMHHEDGGGIVEVYEERQTGYRTLRSSRLRQEGGDHPESLIVQRLQGALPVLLHAQPRRLLVVGLGTGISLATSIRPEVEQVTCVELSEGIIRATAWFEHANAKVMHHPKMTVVRQDGRNFLSLTRARYDLIVQDLFFPYRAGVGNLYTREHYLRVRQRLTSGGRVGQWIALNQVGLLELQSLLRTFTEVFPHTTLWLTGGYLLLDGGLEPLRLDWSTFQQRFDAAPPTEHTNAADVLSMFIAAGAPVQQWAALAPRNTDDNAFIEYSAPRAFATLNSAGLAVSNLQALMSLHRPVTDLFPDLPTAADEQLQRVSQAAQLLWEGMVARTQGQTDQARDLYERAYTLNPANYQSRRFLEQDLAARGRRALLDGHLAHATVLLQRAVTLNAHNPDAQFDLALLHAKRGEHVTAVTMLRRLLSERPEFPHGRFNLGLSLYHLGRYAEAAAQFTHVVQQHPTSVDAMFNLANSLAQAGAPQAALHWYQRTLRLAPTHQLARDNLHALQSWLAAQRHP